MMMTQKPDTWKDYGRDRTRIRLPQPPHCEGGEGSP